jgi:hypothetical protein
MRRMLAIAAMLALAAPIMATAKDHDKGGGPKGAVKFGGPHFPIVGGPIVHGHGPVHGPVHVPVEVPVKVVGPAPWMFHGQSYAWHPVPYPQPWVYPEGYAYRLWGLGEILPDMFWKTPTYYYAAWATMGLPPPDPGFQYVQYGPDLLLVNVATGAVVQVFPNAFS